MQYLMSRYGGTLMLIGGGKASAQNLPENQDLDNLLENYANELSPKLKYISSYDAMVGQFGGHAKLPQRAVKLGRLSHIFNDILIQYEEEIDTDIYLFIHQYGNVIGLMIKSDKRVIKEHILEYTPYYDYVQTTWFRYQEFSNYQIKEHTEHIEMALLILLYKMGLTYEGYILNFSPSKTYLGKKLSPKFCEGLKTKLIDIETDEQLTDLLRKEGYQF